MDLSWITTDLAAHLFLWFVAPTLLVAIYARRYER